jgi:hypothetical protein
MAAWVAWSTCREDDEDEDEEEDDDEDVWRSWSRCNIPNPTFKWFDEDGEAGPDIIVGGLGSGLTTKTDEDDEDEEEDDDEDEEDDDEEDDDEAASAKAESALFWAFNFL